MEGEACTWVEEEEALAARGVLGAACQCNLCSSGPAYRLGEDKNVRELQYYSRLNSPIIVSKNGRLKCARISLKSSTQLSIVMGTFRDRRTSSVWNKPR